MTVRRQIKWAWIGMMLLSAVLLVSCQKKQTPEWASGTSVEVPRAVLRPAGKLVSFGTAGEEEHALDCRYSPDGRYLAVLGRFHVLLWDVSAGRTLKSLRFPDRLVGTYSGLLWARDGRSLFVSVTSSRVRAESDRILRINTADPDSIVLETAFVFREKRKRRPIIPNQLAFAPDGKQLLAVLSGRNELVQIDLERQKITRRLPVGKFPYGLIADGERAYVSNWGGRTPRPGEPTALAGWNSVRGNEEIVAEPRTGGAASGTVSIVGLEDWRVEAEIPVGLHPAEMALLKGKNLLFVANGNSDDVSVVDLKNLRETGRIPVSLSGELAGSSSPAGLALSSDGKKLFVSAGMLNAVAVFDLDEALAGEIPWSRAEMEGLIPTGAYPAGLAVSPGDSVLAVADLEGLLARATTEDPDDPRFQLFHARGNRPTSTAGKYNAHRQFGYFSLIPIPDAPVLRQMTAAVLENQRAQRAAENLQRTLKPPRPGRRPVPVPERVGEPSVFEHVLYIIKENRTYDQVLGDMAEGDGDSSLTVFGEKVTPNHHKLAREFALLDRYFVNGKCSAEGHPWSAAGYVTDYVERHVRGWFRGYYHVILDAMVTPRYGYIWDAALAAGLTFRNYGEAMECIPEDPSLTWSDFYRAFRENAPILRFRNEGTIRAAVEHAAPGFPAYDHHKIPDVLRARAFLQELKKFEETGEMPRFMIMILPADHTAGVRPGFPTPRAAAADNDLALGMIVEAISKSKFWKNTVIFVTEDDSQDGWDHVSAYRTVGFVISAYSRLQKTIHTHYDQLSMLHTMQQILGLKPLNLLVLSAPLMRDCFTDKPDLRPYGHVTNRVPLDELNPRKQALSGKARYWAEVAETQLTLDLDNEANDDILNRMIWYACKGYDTPYPEAFAEE